VTDHGFASISYSKFDFFDPISFSNSFRIPKKTLIFSRKDDIAVANLL